MLLLASAPSSAPSSATFPKGFLNVSLGLRAEFPAELCDFSKWILNVSSRLRAELRAELCDFPKQYLLMLLLALAPNTAPNSAIFLNVTSRRRAELRAELRIELCDFSKRIS